MKNLLRLFLLSCLGSACVYSGAAQDVNVGIDAVDASAQSRVQDPDSSTAPTNSTAVSSASAAMGMNSWWIGQAASSSTGSATNSRQQPTNLQGSATWTPNPFGIASNSTTTSTTPSAPSADAQSQNTKPVLKSSFADRIKKYVATSTTEVQAGALFGADRTDDSDSSANVLDSPRASVLDTQRLRRMVRKTKAGRTVRSRIANPFAPNAPETSGPGWSNVSSAEGLRQQSHESNYLLHYGFNAQSDERAHHRRRAHKAGTSRDRS
jgi:hypothetical protein